MGGGRGGREEGDSFLFSFRFFRGGGGRKGGKGGRQGGSLWKRGFFFLEKEGFCFWEEGRDESFWEIEGTKEEGKGPGKRLGYVKDSI